MLPGDHPNLNNPPALYISGVKTHGRKYSGVTFGYEIVESNIISDLLTSPLDKLILRT